MHQSDFIFVMHQRLAPQPLQERLLIRCLYNVLNIVASAGFARTGRDGHEMQIMVA